MSITREEATRILAYLKDNSCSKAERVAMNMALTALRHQIWKDQLWHDAKTDPPKTPGLYYGKKDDTNSMYACQYRDGVWVLDMYPQQKMEIVQWADYTAFARENERTALRPVNREQVEKVWRGEWEDMREAYNDVPKRRCSCCKSVFIGLDTPFCEACGAPMTAEAVDMMLERWREALDENT